MRRGLPDSRRQSAAHRMPHGQRNRTMALDNHSAMPSCRECSTAAEVPIAQAHHACMTRNVRTAYSGRYQNAAGLHPATGSAPLWLQALCVSHLCSYRKGCWECGSHAADRRQSFFFFLVVTRGTLMRVETPGSKHTSLQARSEHPRWIPITFLLTTGGETRAKHFCFPFEGTHDREISGEG